MLTYVYIVYAHMSVCAIKPTINHPLLSLTSFFTGASFSDRMSSMWQGEDM